MMNGFQIVRNMYLCHKSIQPCCRRHLSHTCWGTQGVDHLTHFSTEVRRKIFANEIDCNYEISRILVGVHKVLTT